MNSKNIFCTVALFSLFGMIGCKRTTGYNSITIVGSDTMVNLMQSEAEEFMKTHPNDFIAVTGGGSGTGIANLIGNTCDIAAASRKMKDAEMSKAKENGLSPTEFIVGMDGIAVVVHPLNKVNQLTIDELSDIFTGKITNWKQLGGSDKQIMVLSREMNSGTHIYFKEHVLQKGDAKSKAEFASSALLLPSSQAIADEVSQNPQAIGYYGMGYISSNQKALKIAREKGGIYYEPSIANVTSGDYPISRPLLLYTATTGVQTKVVVKEFIDFMLTDKGQEIVKQTDFVPIK